MASPSGTGHDTAPGCLRHKGDPHNLCEECWKAGPASAPADPVVSPADPPEWNAWVEDAVNHDAGMWENEEIRWRKALYVGTHSERDRRSIHAESARAIKETLRFWKGIPAEYRERLALEAGLPSTAIPEELRVAADPVVSPADTPALCPGSKGDGCDCRMNGTDPGCPFMPGHDIRPRPVSPADTIRQFIRYHARPGNADHFPVEVALDALLAVGERDKAEAKRWRVAWGALLNRLGQLSDALIRLVNYLGAVGAAEDDAIHTLVRQARAVLADKEDAE